MATACVDLSMKGRPPPKVVTDVISNVSNYPLPPFAIRIHPPEAMSSSSIVHRLRAAHSGHSCSVYPRSTVFESMAVALDPERILTAILELSRSRAV